MINKGGCCTLQIDSNVIFKLKHLISSTFLCLSNQTIYVISKWF